MPFHEEMIRIYERARDECDYNATRFLPMVQERGGLEAAHALLHASVLSEGLVKLWELGRLDLSMEALILRTPWDAYLSEEEQAIARDRLRDLGYQA